MRSSPRNNSQLVRASRGNVNRQRQRQPLEATKRAQVFVFVLLFALSQQRYKSPYRAVNSRRRLRGFPTLVIDGTPASSRGRVRGNLATPFVAAYRGGNFLTRRASYLPCVPNIPISFSLSLPLSHSLAAAADPNCDLLRATPPTSDRSHLNSCHYIPRARDGAKEATAVKTPGCILGATLHSRDARNNGRCTSHGQISLD